MSWQVIQGDCIETLKRYPDNTFDSVVTDPPYALSFMGKGWDSFGDGRGFQAWCEDWARECLRVLKPGGHLLAFGATRTYHREACAIEDAGFQIRDSLHWIYGSGFPKSHDVSKAIDRAAGAEREVIGKGNPMSSLGVMHDDDWKSDQEYNVTAPATEAAKQWDGWGTALKPAHEPIIMARKPLGKKLTVAKNVLAYGTGGLNVDDCRIGTETLSTHSRGHNTAFPKRPGESTVEESGRTQRQDQLDPRVHEGRWPPNIILSDDAADEMDRQSGETKSVRNVRKQAGGIVGNGTTHGHMQLTEANVGGFDDSGGASRFFPCFKYQAKAPERERPVVEGIPAHPTVKPVALMRWLVKLVTPPGGTVLDPFGGTGTTAEACELEGFDCMLIERDTGYLRLIEARMAPYAVEAA